MEMKKNRKRNPVKVWSYIISIIGVFFLFDGFYKNYPTSAAIGGIMIGAGLSFLKIIKKEKENKLHIDALNVIIENGFMFQQEQITVIRKQEAIIQDLKNQLKDKNS